MSAPTADVAGPVAGVSPPASPSAQVGGAPATPEVVDLAPPSGDASPLSLGGVHLSLPMGPALVSSRAADGGRSSHLGFAVAFRPEILVRVDRRGERSWLSFGGFGEFGTEGASDFVAGGGASAFVGRHVGASVGAHARSVGEGPFQSPAETARNRFQPGITASLFLGTHAIEDPLLIPLGLRIDVRLGLGDRAERAFVASIDVDPLLTVGGAIIAAWAVGHIGD